MRSSVSDGSTDGTVQSAQRYPIKVVALEKNLGKGGAMKAGANHTDCSILLFLDADLVGLQRKHIEDLLYPVLSGQTEMSIGVVFRGPPLYRSGPEDYAFALGQRAVKKELFDAVPDLEDSRYGVETALTQYAERQGVHIVKVPLPHMSHVTKEEKRGFVPGLQARLEMYKDIARSLRSEKKALDEECNSE